MNAMLDPSTHAANTQLRWRLAQGAVLGVERMTNSSHGRALRVLIPQLSLFASLARATRSAGTRGAQRRYSWRAAPTFHGARARHWRAAPALVKYRCPPAPSARARCE